VDKEREQRLKSHSSGQDEAVELVHDQGIESAGLASGKHLVLP
jgi:hypothetical protein